MSSFGSFLWWYINDIWDLGSIPSITEMRARPGSEEGAVESDPGGEEDWVDHRTNLTASSDLTAVAALARVESGVKSTPWERRKTWRE